MGEVFAGPGFRICSRSACRWPAVATLSFDYSGKRAWLDDLKPGPDPSRYDLCAVHAERFAAPARWEFEDRRTAPPSLADYPTAPDQPFEAVENLHSPSPSSPAEGRTAAKRAGRRNS